MKLIDKNTLVAEIERRIKERDKKMKGGYWISSTYVYEDLLNFLDTLELKEVDLDNHTIMEEIRKCGCNPSEFDVARHFFELGLKAQKGE